MKLRIAIWAAVGTLVVALQALYFFTSHTGIRPSGAVWALIVLTCPVALASQHPLSIYFVLVTNAVSYALIGTVVETIRRHWKQPRTVSS
jgi:hypothetical protein